MTKKELFVKLYQLLREQEKIIDRLISCGEEQAACLRENKLQAMQEVVQQQNLLSRRLDELEKTRLDVQQKLELETSLPAAGTLLEMARHAGDEWQPQFQDIHSSLRQKIQQLQEINSLNHILAKQGLQFASVMLNVFRAPAANVLYSAEGRRDSGIKKNTTFNKTV